MARVVTGYVFSNKPRATHRTSKWDRYLDGQQWALTKRDIDKLANGNVKHAQIAISTTATRRRVNVLTEQHNGRLMVQAFW